MRYGSQTNQIVLLPGGSAQFTPTAPGLPTAPTNVSAAPGNQQVILTWNPVLGPSTYNVKWSTTSGGPYVTLTNGVVGSFLTVTGLTNGTSYYFVVSTVQGANQSGPSAEAGTILPVPPQTETAIYALEGNALDTSGNGNNGAAYNAAYVTGKVGAQAAQFNGTSAYVQIPRCISADFSVAMWVNTTNNATGSQWWSGKGLVDGEVSGAAADWGTVVLNGRFALGIGNPDTTITSSAAITNGVWHHVVATRDNTSGAMNVYVDGVLSGSGTWADRGQD